ncbi:hypothetical protein BH10ACI2_BH10ACI2_04410 [soil metagenome]
MPVKREEFIESMRGYLGWKFGHQGRSKQTGIDCGGLILVGARQHGISELEFLGYSDFPTDGKFEALLHEHADFKGEWVFPFGFDGSELQAGDMVSFDYGNGEGTRHLAIITSWDGRHYRVIEAQPKFGVCEHALSPPFVVTKTVLQGWGLRGLE